MTSPTKKAEDSFRTTAYLGAISVLILSLACAWFAFSPQSQVDRKPKQRVTVLDVSSQGGVLQAAAAKEVPSKLPVVVRDGGEREPEVMRAEKGDQALPNWARLRCSVRSSGMMGAHLFMIQNRPTVGPTATMRQPSSVADPPSN